VGNVYLQFLARAGKPDLGFEALSEVSAPALASLLSSKQELLRHFGFRRSSASPNYAQAVAVDGSETLLGLSGTALTILRNVYEVRNLKDTRWKLRIPSVGRPATPIRVAGNAPA